MRVYVPCADVNLRKDKLGGKGNFCCRLSCAFRLLGIEVVADPKIQVDVSVDVTWKEHPNPKVRLVRLAGVCHNLKQNYQKKNSSIMQCLQDADGVVYQTQFTKMICDKYLGKFSKPWRVIFNGADPEFYKNVPSVDTNDKKIVLAFSRWRPHKRLRDIIESFLLVGLKDVVLFVAGDLSKSGLEKGEYDKYFKLPNVRYIGSVDQTILASYLNAASASIHLCWVDGCPNSVVEAIAAGVPVICNNVGGVQELVSLSGGFVCDVDNSYDMSPVDLYHPPSIDRKKIAEKIEACCRQRIEVKNDHVLIQNIAKQYLEFMQELVDRN